MRKYLKFVIVIFLILIIAFWFYLKREKGNPEENFEFFFKSFKENYALFDIKKVDWDNWYNQYSVKINENTSDKELFNIFQEVLYKLNDKHCYIYRFNQIYFSGFGLSSLNYFNLLSFDFRVPVNDFSLKLIKKKYLKKGYEKSLRVYSILPPIGIRNIFTTGWLTDTIAYLHMTEMSNKSEKVHNAINDFFERYGSAGGFVIDIRDNIGGYSIPVKELAERFTDKKHLYAISRLRNPDNIHSYKEPEFWTIKPCSGENYKNKPVALLTNENTQSAAELFALMMKTLPNVISIGTTTSGVFADTFIGKLPNGWEYRMSVRKTTDSNDISLEDIGIIPDILIKNTKQDINNGKDKVIEHAIKYLTSREEKQGYDRPKNYFIKNSFLPADLLKNTEALEKEISKNLSKGYKVLDFKIGDINNDRTSDLILIIKWEDEKKTSDVAEYSEPRPLLLLTNNGSGLALAAHNKKVVYCINCGGIWGDPYAGIAHKGNYFSIEHYGGSNWRWTKIITFKYDPEEKKWFLHKVGGVSFHTSDPDNVKKEIKTTSDFGKIEFSQFNINNY